jgi:hypothetical protein
VTVPIWWVFALVVPCACSTGFLLGLAWAVAVHVRRLDDQEQEGRSR